MERAEPGVERQEERLRKFKPVYACLWLQSQVFAWQFVLAEAGRAQMLACTILVYELRLKTKLQHLRLDLQQYVDADQMEDVQTLQ